MIYSKYPEVNQFRLNTMLDQVNKFVEVNNSLDENFDFKLKPPTGKVPENSDFDVDTEEITVKSQPLIKGYMPYYIYQPPFGYPRLDLNIGVIKQLGRSPYVMAVKRAIIDRITSLPWDIVLAEGVEETPELTEKKLKYKKFFRNPNRNKESIEDLTRKILFDVFDYDAGVMVKVFNLMGEFDQVLTFPGQTFLINPDSHNYIGGRADYVSPMYTPMPDNEQMRPAYYAQYGNKAAYFQYSYTAGAMPIPFGKREVIYFMLNPQSDMPYGIAPVQILQEVLLLLIYGERYNLDEFTSNIPAGILSLMNAKSKQIKSIRQKMDNFLLEYDPQLQSWRKKEFKIPISNVESSFTTFKIPSKNLEIIAGQRWFWKIVFACFGLNSDEMGDTEDSNKAVSRSQDSKIPKRALLPITKMLEYKYTTELLWELDPEHIFEFKYIQTDIQEDLAFADLLTKKLSWASVNEVRELDKLPPKTGKEKGADTVRGVYDPDMQMQFGNSQNSFGSKDNNSLADKDNQNEDNKNTYTKQNSTQEKDDKEKEAKTKASIDDIDTTRLDNKMINVYSELEDILKGKLKKVYSPGV